MKKLSFFLIVILLLIACNSVKRVGEKEHLLKEVTVLVERIETDDDEITKFIIQKPNTKTLGISKLPLYLYSIGNNKYPETPSKWGIENPKTYKSVKAIFSEKQSIAFSKTFIGLNNWFLNSGEAPVIIDDKKTNKTVKNLETYFSTIGYFQTNIKAKTKLNKNKKGNISYEIEKGKPTVLDSIFKEIKSPELDSIYNSYKSNSFLKTGDVYNEENFRKEADRITSIFRNNGAYYFSNSSIGFFKIDTANIKNKSNVLLKVEDRVIENNGGYSKKPFRVQKINNVNVVTDYSYNNRNNKYQDSIKYNGITFYGYDKIKHNPKYLSQSLFTRKNDIYSDSLRNLTRNHLKTLNNFKGINIAYEQEKGTTNKLNSTILLTPIEKYTLGLDTELTHSNIREIGISGKFSLTARNSFKGSELLKMSFLGSYFESNIGPGFEIGADLSLEIPRLLAPFGLSKLVPKRMFPKTLFSVGTSIQSNIGLDRQTFSLLADYKWQFNAKRSVELEIFNTQYIRNLNVSNYFDIYTSEFNKLNDIAQIYNNGANFPLQTNPRNPTEILNFSRAVSQDTNFRNSNPEEFSTNQNIRNRYDIITSDFIIPVIAYSFVYNTQVDFKDKDFSYFRGRLANSGNVLGILSGQRNADDVNTLFGIPIAQYFKLDLEYKKFWSVTSKSEFAFRTFLGGIYAYDNSRIPFTKSYFAGGSNDIRAWQTYDLGPGKTNTGLEFNVGSLKLLTTAEYRFDVFGSLEGALFVDAGNIWDVTDRINVDDASRFDGFSSFEDIAVGSGFGIRYDFSFLVLRLDVGLKTYEPYLETNKWFSNYSLDKAVYNIGINYPF